LWLGIRTDLLWGKSNHIVKIRKFWQYDHCSNKVHMHNQKLKLGLLLDSFNVPAWIYGAIHRITQENSSIFTLVVLNADDAEPFEKNAKVYSVFNRIDEKLFTKEPDPFALRSVVELLPDVPIINILPIRGNNVLFFGEADVENIRTYKLDILIKFGFDGLQLPDLKTSEYGTWFYYHGDDRIMKGGPPGFWEVVDNWSETGTALIAQGGELSLNRVLFRSCFFTYPLSPARHRSYYFWATTPFFARQISLLRRLGSKKYFEETEKFNTALLREIKGYTAPSNFLTVKSILKLVRRLIKECSQRLFYKDRWFLLYSFEQDISDNLNEFKKIMPPKDKFWADPHLIQVDKRYYIFIEEFLHAKNKGHISVIELDETGNWKSPVKVLEKDYHLSYPFIFKWNDKFYMVPESGANKTIDLYECSDFPYKWDFKQCIMENISAVDTTIIHYGDKWWLFTAVAENEAAAPNVELFLFYSDDIFNGKWVAHPRNPIVSDVKSARPAGSIFVKDGKLFRPSQDCSHVYGYGFDLNEIELLSETEYSERKTKSVRPNWDKNIQATHTYANWNNLTVIDVFTQSRKFG